MDTDHWLQFAFLGAFSARQREALAHKATRVTFAPGQNVFRAGDRSDAMYLILAGKVTVHRADEGGDDVELDTLGVGHAFGELALLSGEPRAATITTVEPSEFLVIERATLLESIDAADPEEIFGVFAALSELMRTAHEQKFQSILAKRTLAMQMDAMRQRALTHLVAGVAHELNTPLGVANTAASILARELGSSEGLTPARVADILEALDVMRRNIERAHRLVQDFKKVAVGQLTDSKELFDVSAVIRETIGLLAVSLKRSKITVELDDRLAPAQKAHFGCRGPLSQILINLLTNVERYGYPGEVGGVATVAISLEGDEYLLTVRDSGKGIPEADQARIFEPFFTTGRAIGGTGLGLAIVHNLVTSALHGAIRMRSVEGSGTTFLVSFPRALAA